MTTTATPAPQVIYFIRIFLIFFFHKARAGEFKHASRSLVTAMPSHQRQENIKEPM